VEELAEGILQTHWEHSFYLNPYHGYGSCSATSKTLLTTKVSVAVYVWNIAILPQVAKRQSSHAAKMFQMPRF
jgi:hypothetical protein